MIELHILGAHAAWPIAPVDMKNEHEHKCDGEEHRRQPLPFHVCDHCSEAAISIICRLLYFLDSGRRVCIPFVLSLTGPPIECL